MDITAKYGTVPMIAVINRPGSAGGVPSLVLVTKSFSNVCKAEGKKSSSSDAITEHTECLYYLWFGADDVLHRQQEDHRYGNEQSAETVGHAESEFIGNATRERSRYRRSGKLVGKSIGMINP
eukprot:jgi/Psemu1/24508/gm1.24508_g